MSFIKLLKERFMPSGTQHLKVVRSEAVDLDSFEDHELQEVFRPIADAVSTELNNKVVQFLGKGSCGYAFLLKDDTVLKITTQNSEYITSSSLVGRVVPHVNEIFNTFLINTAHLDTYYAIHQAYVDMDSYEWMSNLRWELEGCVDDPFNFLGDAVMAEDIDEEHLELIDECKAYLLEKGECKEADFIDELVNLTKSLIAHRIFTPDALPCNLGRVNGVLTVFDLGYSDTSEIGEINKNVIKVAL